MDIWTALLPLVICVMVGGAVALAIKLYTDLRNRNSKKELPTDALAYLFTDKED